MGGKHIPSHGETYCEHCNSYVLLCSHGCGLDWAELYRRQQKVMQKMAEALEGIESGKYRYYEYDHKDDGTFVPTDSQVVNEALKDYYELVGEKRY